jgi:hypothetical protein
VKDSGNDPLTPLGRVPGGVFAFGLVHLATVLAPVFERPDLPHSVIVRRGAGAWPGRYVNHAPLYQPEDVLHPRERKFWLPIRAGGKRTTRPRACFAIGSPRSYPPRPTNGLGPAGASPSEELPRHRHSARQLVDAAALALVELLPCRA